MTKDESALVGLEIVAYAGDARSHLMKALEAAKNGDYAEAEVSIKQADEAISHAHATQTSMIQAEARGESAEFGFIMVHGQDHLMTTMLLRDMMQHMIELYRRTN
ncbi:PTS lactose/cellobiose transporter subunit IIA [Exiguobacterium sp. SH0S1]|uniref:PTS lactose/cellobiose transporter subunit IIA n=1 Tax=Exiguobacterium sp. SH0S1 TaxID=2510949 RepID=UPI00103C4CD9|nr:PTS lactose/cellobiose transporter subunit IIA [Exiguobacterium sp. SH0S1]TCI77780.1 PTS lactose/cellobiose transporter subunit IIA [Exiguobacterium sp. SH0S1]